MKTERRPARDIAADLRDYLDGDPHATVEDAVVEDLYREWHNITGDQETNLERVKQWVESIK